jgi:periplasmic protein TonB
MKYYIFLLFFVMQSVFAFGQRIAARETPKEDVAALVKPQYPGGEKEMQQYFALNLHYPTAALSDSIEGEVVVGFVVEKDGRISNVKALNRIGYGCDEEAERVVRNMPQWKPATRRGKAIAVKYKLPVVFELPANPVSSK